MARPILLIDDNSSDHHLLAVAMVELGSRDCLAYRPDGRSAIELMTTLLDRDLPRVVVLDLNMPVMHGFEVLRWIRSQRRLAGTRVVVFSTSRTDEDAAASRRLGADDYVEKPLDYEGLLAFASRLSAMAFGG